MIENLSSAKFTKVKFYSLITKTFPLLKKAYKQRLIKRLKIFPSILSVELTNKCNASCIMCPRQHMKRPQGFISRSLFEFILQEASWNQRFISLFQPFLFGESLLHPEFGKLIRLAREKLPNTKIYLSTNGALLNEENALHILEAKVDKLNVDIDGFTAETAEKIRRNVQLDLVKENVHRFLALRQKNNANTRLRISIIKMPQNENEISVFSEYWRKFADQVQVVNLNTWLGNVKVATEPKVAFDFPCRHPYEELAISWDGKASLCCLDFDFKHQVGLIPQQTIRSIWRSMQMENARNMLENLHYDELPICKNCNASRFQQNNLWRYLWLKETV